MGARAHLLAVALVLGGTGLAAAQVVDGSAPAAKEAALESTQRVKAPDAPDLVRKYVPILWLASDERTHPMLPHPFAFDGVDNDGDACSDLADADEVTVEWETLARAEREGVPIPACTPASPDARCQEGGKLDPPPCWTTAPGPRARVMYSDPRPFLDARAGKGDLRKRLGDRKIAVHQYWFYYPYDDGPNGHADDGEHVAVFVEEGQFGRRAVKGVVGAGHMAYNVNNILVTGTPGSDALFPRHLPDHMPILVELGKHASAPDRNCDGQFDLGFDANLYPEGVWGSRDVWAANVGQALKVGSFKDWYSYPRSREKVYVESGWEDAHIQLGYKNACAGYDERLASVLEKVFDPKAPPAEKQVFKEFDLFPLARMVELYAEIAADDPTGTRIAAFFARPGHAETFWSGATSIPPLHPSAKAVQAMKKWTESTSPLREVWLHEAYKDPNSDFREWLFRRAGVGISTKADGGNWVSGFALRFSEIRLPKKFLFIPLPRGLGGAQAFHDSRIELYAHFEGVGGDKTTCETGKTCFYDAGIDFFSGRGRFGGSYVGVTWNEEYNARSWYQHLGLGAGVEVGLPSVAFWKWARPASVMLNAGLSAQLFRPRATDVANGDPLAREVRGVRAQVGLRVIYGFWRPRHPLSY